MSRKPAATRCAFPLSLAVAAALSALPSTALAAWQRFGTSVEGRDLRAYVHDGDGPTALLFARQHGNEPAGTEALDRLVRELADGAYDPPADARVVLIPVVNPDGAAANARRNAADADLNRDHQALLQPETAALHRLIQRERPVLAVDLHEFNRTSGDYADRGWTEAPLITADCFNHPTLAGVDAAESRLAGWLAQVAAAGFPTARYLVGDAPGTPGGECRHSTLDADDARNAAALHGAHGYIIETGISRAAPDPAFDLERRAAGALLLVKAMLADIAALEPVRPIPSRRFPVNAFYATLADDADAGTMPTVTVMAAGRRTAVDAPNLHTDRVVKAFVLAADAFAVASEAATPFDALLDRHGFGDLVDRDDSAREQFRVRDVFLIGQPLDDAYDPTYHRYAGRSETRTGAARSLSANEHLVDTARLADPAEANRLRVLLEPRQLYGLYQWPVFHALVDADGRLPIRPADRVPADRVSADPDFPPDFPVEPSAAIAPAR